MKSPLRRRPAEPTLDTPCVRNCCLDGDSVCLGCGRSLGEILAWHEAPEPQRRAILEQAARRRAAAQRPALP